MDEAIESGMNQDANQSDRGREVRRAARAAVGNDQLRPMRDWCQVAMPFAHVFCDRREDQKNFEVRPGQRLIDGGLIVICRSNKAFFNHFDGCVQISIVADGGAQSLREVLAIVEPEKHNPQDHDAE